MKKRVKCLAAVFFLAAALSGCMADPYEDGVEALKEGQFEEAAKQFQEAESYRGKIQDAGKMIDGAQEFVLREKQVREFHYGTAYGDLQERIDAYQSVLEASEDYRAFEDEMTALLGVDVNGISTVTLFGNNGYLFHRNENDGTSLHDYIGDNHFSQKELEAIAANLEKEKKYVEQNGSKFVLLLIPNTL